MLEDDKWINKDSKDQWLFLNAGDTYRRVTEVNGYRLSVIYHTPQHLHSLTSEDWQALRESGFPADAVWEMGLSFPDEDQDEEIGEVFQTLCESVNMTPQVSLGSEDASDQEVGAPTLPDSAILRPTLQAILWISEIVAKSGTSEERVPYDGHLIDSQKTTREMTKVNDLVKSITETRETSLTVLRLAEILIAVIRLTICLGMQGHRFDAFTCA